MIFFAALRFLTTISLPWLRANRPEEVGRATVCFPLIGLIIGLILTGLNWLLRIFLPEALSNALLIAAMALLTGALHLDGFIDTCDGIAGHKTAAERWEVMRDSRAGSFGIVGVVLLLLVKYAALNTLPQPLVMVTLLFMPVVSRWAMVYAIFTQPYTRPSGLGAAFKEATTWPRFVIATLTTIIIAIALMPLWQLTALIIILVIWAVTALTSLYLRGKFAGLTGDTYGAINEVAEASVLVIVVVLASFGLA